MGGQAFAIGNSVDAHGLSADNYLDAAADYTGVHEMGHMLGGRHPQDSNLSPTAIQRGIINTTDPNNKWQTMMANYQSLSSGTCTFMGPTSDFCERIPYFSNPNLSYNGDPLGYSNANMKNFLNGAMYAASNWETEPLPPPAAPTSLSVTSGQCYGFSETSWNSSNNATSYQLYKSTHLYFYSPTLVYTGSQTGSFVIVSSGGWNLRVKACNAAGCSGYSNQVYAAYANYCK